MVKDHERIYSCATDIGQPVRKLRTQASEFRMTFQIGQPPQNPSMKPDGGGFAKVSEV